MKVLDAMQVGQRKGKSFSLFGCDELIDVDRVNRLLTFPVATTVAKGIPASDETGKKDVSHHCHPSRTTDAGQYAIPIRDKCSGDTPAAAVPVMITRRTPGGKRPADRAPHRPNVMRLVDLNTSAP